MISSYLAYFTPIYAPDCTTLDQAVAKDVSAQIRTTGAQMIDAPVSGGNIKLNT